ncbi:putative cytochrome c oxidase subunit I, cytochrome c oxidase-like, subunit I [Helianthus annuus]|uniref:Cytochrome c oxidase subunit I, cytochrome c oxidase-like, subunit I n=1 Tax=Helianthus annuus TaxID=4232 RepID=A0A251RWE7_HELAN|nr:putative cytochrome c oxidase subunit I, cytochrome c oxidase-like, subunit I [Helianthus annuus]KAJ0459133.1 putative cytochrome c oxidase subunit I, cytochrome c oxidase-like, subunit I [Helianthus annuus]KAJ0639689.1 putative cytochrome c oxidase subunit I, cytochrome c oxidase-like, subunit I [Helianthus annuus]KAJ0680480.1 putative cytochrome c oxidase subunit I, cytochrome c oxidase-like, subunit I [Helianthus annuus]
MGAVFALFAGFHYWVGKIFGRTYPETLGQIHFWITFFGVNPTFFPMHFFSCYRRERQRSQGADHYSPTDAVYSRRSVSGAPLFSSKVLIRRFPFFKVIVRLLSNTNESLFLWVRRAVGV